ncbi:MAG: hypothetical protein ACTHZ9_09155 [Leucobacter sp.]
MGELSCTFPALVFSELYRLLSENPRYTDALEDSLSSIHLSHDWLEEMADAYARKWEEERHYVTAANINDIALSEQHSQFATWLLAHLHANGTCGGLSTDLGTSVMQRALEDVAGVELPLPPVLSPVIIGWTLGSVVSAAEDDLPVVPAIWPSHPNVRVAFNGLIEHVLAVQAMPPPLPEMVQTAMYWRGYGLAEALRPDLGAGGRALNQLQLETLSSMEDAQRLQVSNHLTGFRERRNALSHIADDQGRKGFVEIVDEVRETPPLSLTMRAMTQFVFHDVAREIRDRRPSVVRNGVEEILQREIHVWS